LFDLCSAPFRATTGCGFLLQTKGSGFKFHFSTQKKPRVLRGFFLRLIDTVQGVSADPLVHSFVDSGQHPKGGETANRKSFTIALFTSNFGIAWRMRSSLIYPISPVSINIMPRNPESFYYFTAHVASIRPGKRFRLPSLRRLAHHVCTRSHYQSEIGRFVNLLLVFRSNYKRTILIC